ncbi:FeoA domain-containing protein [Pseudomonas sp. LS44]|uniref:FeoA domain-containing protein n=1 Tax=Pseudomonas sp. LS44 TaxID=1357074 RepID=UPI00215ABDBE|nr:FeoA domain-containing protein [Pseudomonas sp. LS44]UVE18447.1 FeoA domain-containing protein [Pseudomonas sp. LS44]
MPPLQLKQHYRISAFTPGMPPAYRNKLLALGLLPGAQLQLVRIAPLGDPIEVRTRQTSLMLRRQDLSLLQLDAEDY